MLPFGPAPHDRPSLSRTCIHAVCVSLLADAAINPAVCTMWRVYRLTREFQAVNNRKSKLKIWKVIEATVQSTAIYSAAAVSLVITFVNSTSVGYPTCLNVFPALIVRLSFLFVVCQSPITRLLARRR